MSVSGALHRDWRDRQHAFEEIAITRTIANFNLTGAQEPERVLGARVSSNLFRVLGVQPLLGRTFRDGEDRISLDDAGGADINIVILSYGLWQRRFGGDPSVLGTSLLLSGQAHTIVGIMRPRLPVSQPRIRAVGAAHHQPGGAAHCASATTAFSRSDA